MTPGTQATAATEATASLAQARAAAAEVLDPEVPVLTIDDLGVLRDVSWADDGAVEVTITPTYSGCPAMGTITDDVRAAVAAQGFPAVRVVTVLSPAWTTDWMSEAGRRKLAAYGVAPPRPPATGPVALTLGVRCPQCGSLDTAELSRFGSTSCKSLWRCGSCREPFDHFKAI